MVIKINYLKNFWNFGAGRTAMGSFFIHSLSISIGMCQGYSAILIPQLQEENDEIIINTEESSWLASLGAITNPIGSILSGLLAEYFGRKKSIQISTIPFLIGWLLIGFSKTINWLYAGRLVTGIAAGMATTCYIYVSEISTPENRGIFQSLGPICASFGILLTYTLGYFFKWSIVALISLIFAVFTLITVEFIPESPAYLIKTLKKDETFQSLLWYRRNNNLAQQELNNYTKNLDENPQKKFSEKLKLLNRPETYKPFIILVILFFLQELTGIYIILFYAVNFFEQTNLNLNNYLSSIIVGLIRLSMAIICAILLNKYKRKLLCIVSSSGMTLTMLMLAIYFKYYEVHTNEIKLTPLLPIICIIFNVCFSMIGMLPIPWILVGELLPLNVRSIMCGIIICIAQLFIFLSVKIYPNLIEICNFSGTLFIFFSASFLSLIFCKYFLIETKDKTLQDIENCFKNKQNSINNNINEIKGYDNKAFILSDSP